MKIYITLAALFLIALSTNSYAGSCSTYSQQIKQNMDKIRSAQRPTKPDEFEKDQTSQIAQQTRDLISQAQDAGCNPDMEWSMTKWSTPRNLTNTGSEYVPPTPNDDRLKPTATFTPSTILDLLDAFLLPVADPNFKLPSYNFPYKDNAPPTLGNPVNCGAQAAKFVKELVALTGEDKPTYGDDCAGVDNSGRPRTSPSKRSSICDGKQYGKFGLIYAAYNNKYIGVAVSDYWKRSPSQASASSSQIIGFKNTYTGASKTDKCTIGNINSCGKPGDIILIQATNGSLDDSDPYNRFLIYDGEALYEAQNDQTSPIKRYSGVTGEYASSSYEILRMACSKSN